MEQQLTVQTFKDAYEKVGVKPTQATWFYLQEGQDETTPMIDRKIGCACALSTLYMAQNSEDAFKRLYWDENRLHSFKFSLAMGLGLSPDFVIGFVNGFDYVANIYMEDSPKYKGFVLGNQVREAVFTHESTRSTQGVHSQP